MSQQQLSPLHDPLSPPLPSKPGDRVHWGRLYGAGDALSIASAARAFRGLVMVLTEDVQSAVSLEQNLGFFLEHEQIPVFGFPDWETLPYDIFSPLNTPGDLVQ